MICDLHSRITGEGHWQGNTYFTASGDYAGTLPREVQEWIGIDSGSGQYSNDEYLSRSLMGANDNGRTFGEIAEVIFEHF